MTCPIKAMRQNLEEDGRNFLDGNKPKERTVLKLTLGNNIILPLHDEDEMR